MWNIEIFRISLKIIKFYKNSTCNSFTITPKNLSPPCTIVSDIQVPREWFDCICSDSLSRSFDVIHWTICAVKPSHLFHLTVGLNSHRSLHTQTHSFKNGGTGNRKHQLFNKILAGRRWTKFRFFRSDFHHAQIRSGCRTSYFPMGVWQSWRNSFRCHGGTGKYWVYPIKSNLMHNI